MKLILCEGDSWTAGDIIDPELDETWVNHPSNDDYRLPKVWPYKLGKLLNVDVINDGIAGSSNDGVVRRVLRKIPELLKTYKPEDLFVIIGWSSPERKDLYYNGKWSGWETIYPSQLTQDLSYDEDLETFYRIYIMKFWNKEEYTERYVQHNLLLHHFLNSFGIKHIFFDAFYESKTKTPGSFIKPKNMFSNKSRKKIIAPSLSEESLKLIKDIKENYFVKESFRDLLISGDYFNEELFSSDYHPTEKGHKLWAEHLSKLV